MKFLYLFNSLIDFLNKYNIKYNYTSSPSDSIILDVWYQQQFYVFHFTDNYIGISQVDENVAFDSNPDKIIFDADVFKLELRSIIEGLVL